MGFKFLPQRMIGASPLLLLLCAAFAAGWSQEPSVSERFLLAAANEARAAHQLPPVRIESHLTRAARTHAEKMAERQTISHQFSGEPDLAARASGAGARFSLISENVAEASDASAIHDLWMNSPGHRANLLDPKVDVVGIGVVRNGGEYFAVEDFAHATELLDLDQQEQTVGRQLSASGLQLMADTKDVRATCALSTGFAGLRKPWFVMRYTTSDLGHLPEQLTTRIRSGKYRTAAVGACSPASASPFTGYALAVMLFP